MNIRPKTTIRAALGWLIIIAFAVHGFIPAGYMPDAPKTAGAFPSIRICGGHTSAPTDHSKAKNDVPCPFAASAVFGFEGLPPALPEPLLVPILLSFSFAALILVTQRRFGNASPRAPPA